MGGIPGIPGGIPTKGGLDADAIGVGGAAAGASVATPGGGAAAGAGGASSTAATVVLTTQEYASMGSISGPSGRYCISTH